MSDGNVRLLLGDLSVDLPDHVERTADLTRFLQVFHAAREETYKMSFAKRGEPGIWINLARKYDRIDVLMAKLQNGEDVEEVLVDTLVDIAMYSLKWLQIISVKRPKGFDIWVQNVYCRDTRIPYVRAMANLAAMDAQANYIEFTDGDVSAELAHIDSIT